MANERELVLGYIDERIAGYKAKQLDSATPTDQKYDHAVSAQTLGVLRGDLHAGFHEGHKARREQDEFVCVRCGRRWASDEAEPAQCR